MLLRTISSAILAFGYVHAVSVMVYRNGESTGGVAVEVLPQHVPSGQALAAYLSDFVDVDGIIVQAEDGKEQGKIIADRVVTGKGVHVHAYDDLHDDDKLYLVPPDFHFVWPYVEFGHRVAVESTQSPTGKPIIIESFNDSPRVFLLHDFFSAEEADQLIERTLSITDEAEKLKRSRILAKEVNSVRTSDNAFDSTSNVAISLNKRSFDLLRLGDYKVSMADGLQLLRYQQKQAYIPHDDYFEIGSKVDSDWNFNPKTGGSNRFATVFMYLSNVTRGGQTVFVRANMPEGVGHAPPPSEAELSIFPQGSWEQKMTKQCFSKLASYPQKAHAVLFYSQKGNAELDPMAEHGGCPVLEGTKWGANLWVWNKKRLNGESGPIGTTFANDMDIPLDLYWESNLMATLAPHKSIYYTSYAGHAWSFKDPASGNVVRELKLKETDSDTQRIVATGVPAPTLRPHPVDEL
ncbi:hypothetical protein H310_12431 [Aphanomyces invadans]|uniref:Fe2OG dioxygenase domain-containing protein n=1 Tax=Aphanomyces invadans TaxID=157072 RepID=A0A024TI37_9STRA|nr:hypothetical protein H310_12431 [Aphanomyces invadans]ETV93664.1 hypothetical protein H310_12431 [Aphanomyces invadans]|eukprot:XP_008877705.1 hypothetical protein H310_12431 [Aphanomyces invadans]